LNNYRRRLPTLRLFSRRFNVDKKWTIFETPPLSKMKVNLEDVKFTLECYSELSREFVGA